MTAFYKVHSAVRTNRCQLLSSVSVDNKYSLSINYAASIIIGPEYASVNTVNIVPALMECTV